jgi:hypothetical protein
MRYNLESTLPIDAFSPRGGRNNPFVRGMTLEGGGGGGIGKVFSGVAKGVTDVVKGVVQPVYNATLKHIPGVDQALVGLDKSVGKAIPGGWGTVASVAASFIPGGQFAAMGLSKTAALTGLGALSGSGVMRKGHEFNLQGAIMGGAMAYGASQLSQGLQEAGGGANKAIEESTQQIARNLGVEGANTGIGSQARILAEQNAGLGAEGLKSINAASNQAIQSNLQNAAANTLANAGSNIAGTDVYSGLAGTQGAVPPVAVPQPTGLENLAQAGKDTLSNVADAGRGIKNLTGFGDTSISDAASAFAKPITQEGVLAGIVGTSGMMALEEQRKMLDEQFAQGNIAQAEYDKAKAEIDRQIQIGRETVAANPFRTDTDVSGSLSGSGQDSSKTYETLYAAAPSSTTSLYANKPYAMGGQVDDEMGGDYSAMGMDQGNLQKGLFGLGYAAGGMPRFLSGGGDGMSDSIRANINGTQEARLADGEFVIPADVVSHLGNGSSKAGAKQLYAMMDKVRQARTGRKSQGKQINPRKYLLA